MERADWKAQNRERYNAYMREYRRKVREGEETASRHVTNRPEYGVWRDMHTRCSNARDRSFANYGGRGIAVCAEWTSFNCFFSDMGSRPSPLHTLDRIDNDGPYCRENCRWATRAEQQNNRRANRKVTVHGETMNLRQALRRFGVADTTFRNRIRQGWTEERALTTPPATGPNARNYYRTCQ